jgi:ClpP class serine protease
MHTDIRLRRHLAVPFLVLALALPLRAGASGPISNVQLEEGKKQVFVTYDLEAPGPVQVRLAGSENGGRAFTLKVRDVSGDVGPGVKPGKGKQIVWKFLSDYPNGLQDKDVVLDVRVDPKPRPVGPGYFVIPVRGEVGWEITRKTLETCLAEAAFLKAEVVVLEVTSPGGLISELLDILDLLGDWQRAHPKQRLVAFVDGQAFSAAAIISAACRDIFLKPGSAIGAALAINISARGITAVDEKFSSAFRGKARAAAEAAGHNAIVVEAMIDPDVEVSLTQALGPKAPVDPALKGKLLKARGKLLTLAPGEAVECGFAKAVVKDYDELGEQLGFRGWDELTDFGRRTVAAHEKEMERVMADYDELVLRVKDGLDEIRQLSGRQVTAFTGDVWAIRKAVDEIEQLAVEYPVIAGKAARQFPSGIGNLKAECDRVIRLIKNR